MADSPSTAPIPLAANLPDPDAWVLHDGQQVVDLAWLEPRVEALHAAARRIDDDDAAGWVGLTQQMTALMSHVDSYERLTELAFRRATDDDLAAQARRNFQQDIAPVKRAARAELSVQLLATPARARALEQAFGAHFVKLLRTRVATHAKEAAPLQTEVDCLAREYVTTMAATRMVVDGVAHPLSFARRTASDSDPTVRRAGFRACTTALQPIADRCDQLLARLVERRRDLADAAGFDSFELLRYRELGRFDYTPADVGRLRDAARTHLLPLARDLRARQADALGGTHELVHPADESFDPTAAPGPIVAGTAAQLDAARTAVAAVSPVLAEHFDGIVAEDRFDLPSRPGKAPGAYCATTPDDGRPFVFCNVVGVGRDARTITHEFGHGLQSCLSAAIHPYDLRKPSLEACEVHAMTLELLCLPHVDRFFPHAEDADAYRRQLLHSSVLNVPQYLAGDEFQHRLYMPGADHDADDRGALWEQIAHEWLPGIDHGADPWWARNRWLMIRHLYLFPFYYVDYAIAQIVAWQLWLDALVDPASTVERYLRLCRLGGTMPFAALLEAVDLPNPFSPATVEDLARRLRPHVLGAPLHA